MARFNRVSRVGGGSAEAAGGEAWPLLLSPQQAAVPFALIPQVWVSPALTAVKVPAGGVAWPLPLAPQQATVPFVLIPQV